MADVKLARELETRAISERPKQWAPAELLPEPDKQAGYAYRWVRVATLNEFDPRNHSARLREGWEPVAVEEQPKFKLLADPNSRFQGYIEVGGLLLCKTPEELVRQKDEYYANQTKSQMEGVDNNIMRESDSRLPTLYQKSSTRTTFGKGQ